MHLLSTNDANSVYAGLQCMLAICRMYRYKGGDSRKEFNQIIEASFPQLLAIANRIVQETSMEAWEMLHLLSKAYKHAIYVSQPPAGSEFGGGEYSMRCANELRSSSCRHT